MDASNSDEFYDKLKGQLADTAIWPSKYMYKFIVPTSGTAVTQIETIFDNTGAVITSKVSSKGAFTSLTIVVILKNPDAVVKKYKRVGLITGVISL
jgi:putative lipoic acid-binding regulatory protein